MDVLLCHQSWEWCPARLDLEGENVSREPHTLGAKPLLVLVARIDLGLGLFQTTGLNLNQISLLPTRQIVRQVCRKYRYVQTLAYF